jgi:hypothetical protein
LEIRISPTPVRWNALLWLKNPATLRRLTHEKRFFEHSVVKSEISDPIPRTQNLRTEILRMTQSHDSQGRSPSRLFQMRAGSGGRNTEQSILETIRVLQIPKILDCNVIIRAAFGGSPDPIGFFVSSSGEFLVLTS